MQSAQEPVGDRFPEKGKLGLFVAACPAPTAETPRLTDSTVRGGAVDRAVVCCLVRSPIPVGLAADPMLIESEDSRTARASKLIWPLESSQDAARCPVPLVDTTDATVGADTCPGWEPPLALTVHASTDPLDVTAPPSQALDNDTTSSPTSVRLDSFTSEITMHPSAPLLQKPTQTKAPVTSTVAPKRSSTRLANDKLAMIPAARRGEVLLMRRFEPEIASKPPGACGGVDSVFNDGVSCGNADKMKDMFPFRRANMGRRNAGVIIA